VNNTDDKNRTVRPRVASKDALATSPTKHRRNNSVRSASPDKSTIRTVSRTHKSPEKPTPRSPEKRISTTPQKQPEKSTLGRKFASQIMQPAFEQVTPNSHPGDREVLMEGADTVEEIAR